MQLNELTVLLALNGNKRLEHLEEEIFTSSEDIILYYMSTVIAKYAKWDYRPAAMHEVPFVIALYASATKQRIIAAEYLLDGYYATRYKECTQHNKG